MVDLPNTMQSGQGMCSLNLVSYTYNADTPALLVVMLERNAGGSKLKHRVKAYMLESCHSKPQQ